MYLEFSIRTVLFVEFIDFRLQLLPISNLVSESSPGNHSLLPAWPLAKSMMFAVLRWSCQYFRK